MARKSDLREVDAVVREFGLDGTLRHMFTDYLHELKRSGDRGSKTNGDFMREELRERAQWFCEERLGDGAHD